MMKNLMPDARLILCWSDVNLIQSSATKLSQLMSDQQKEAASMLVSHAIQSVDEYLAKLPKELETQELEDDSPTPNHPFCLPGKQFATTSESVCCGFEESK